ncbi:hypothetical protein FBY35_4088 [Streptomyces sp. SLBN-118]|uniref:hypothetical protein n=1 Tax=Streptomyces sp. SLBN-118 TaxID=2768454 RepID=UPI00116BC1A9|nr:hypothetical protein [Streptomyces sp. SLBN-118]TQK42660.1 hypothetical protein FBY35_4088 [Streptomyces sp. SLBN-118]
MPWRYVPTVALTVLALATLAGCGGTGPREAGASEASEHFERQLVAGRTGAACGALAPGTRMELEESEHKPCSEALAAEQLPEGGSVRKVDVYGRQALVVLEGDTLFLSQFADGWKVVAAGCRPEPDKPYQCTVKGG